MQKFHNEQLNMKTAIRNALPKRIEGLFELGYQTMPDLVA